MSKNYNTAIIVSEKELRRLRALEYSAEEKIFQNNPKYRSKLLEHLEVPFSASVEIKFRKSVFGKFLDAYNYQQTQNQDWNKTKLDILNYDLKEFTPALNAIFKENNNLTDNIFQLLIKAVKESECITWDFLYENLTYLQLSEYHITKIDESLTDFKNLQVLVLAGNWIEEVPGKYLPRNLKFLELFGNIIASVSRMCLRSPKEIFHIGLGRNKLTNGTKFRTMATCRNFSILRSLDLSDNDIYDLLMVLPPLAGLEQLRSLQLEGNPCATSIGYKNAVVSYFPNIIFLDKTEVLDGDRRKKTFKIEELYVAALTFTCHRIVALKPPPKEKGVVQTIHFEISLPLLEEIILEEPEDNKEKKEVKNEKKEKKASTKASTKGSKKGAEPSPYDAPDEYEYEKRNNIKNTSFKTERLPWAKVIQLPEEALIVESPEQNLIAIRDTFRSRVNVKVVYLKVQPPQKPKKEKAKKEKKPKATAEAATSTAKELQTEEEVIPQETILKKVTLANFFCDLHSVNWSDRTIDFYWAQHPDCNPKAIAVEGSLRAINYVEGKAKPPPKKKGDEGENELKKVPSKQFFPKIFTCQVGFGLKRLN